MSGGSHHERALEFMRVSRFFRLGHLPTERPHPETRRLSDWAKTDLPTAVAVLKGIDVQALDTLQRYAHEIDGLARSIEATLGRGRRIFLCGCGATGRLSLSLEFLWRHEHCGDDRVRSFMAGGDVALVHSLEGFEDHRAFGARHLREMGFSDGDLLVSCTEGGETPYVIGATEEAARISSNPPYFLYCNANSELVDSIQRFRRVYDNPKIHKLCLYVGPMALAGSTRMQASTVLQLAVGAALLHSRQPARDLISDFSVKVQETDFSFIADFVEAETSIYLAGDHVHYQVQDYGITVFTDTTERAPTFSLVPFDQLEEKRPQYSLCYVSLTSADNAEDAWLELLNRSPRPLSWPEVDPRTSPEYLYGFDFSVHALDRRRRLIPGKSHHELRIQRSPRGISLRLGGLAHEIEAGSMPDLLQHLLLKQALNIHSTLVMGRMGRYKNNLMTWVSPTNGKLVDRAIRYVRHLLADAGHTGRSYEEIAGQLFVEMERADPGESVVMRTYQALIRESATH
jgi:N-acetylmuramic acid 6-phosphate etherase